MLVLIALAVCLVGWAYHSIKPPRSKICGSVGGPPITSPRVKLSDGRHLAYKEAGVPKEVAEYKIILVHGFASSKDLQLPVSRELIEDLKIYFLSFDRAGYGESDPNPSRSVKSEAFDIQELADKLQIGSKFYILGVSMGGYPAWSCLKYIPHRLAGVSLVVPFVNSWWSHFPPKLQKLAFSKLPVQDQWSFRVAHYTPWLFYWWMTQKWFPSLSMLSGNMAIFSPSDLEVLKKISGSPSPEPGLEKNTQQGVYESLHRDLMVGYGKGEFGPLDLDNPFPANEGSVHIWQGGEDRIIPFEIHRYIADKLPWIKYHEVPDLGHMLVFESNICEAILKALVLE